MKTIGFCIILFGLIAIPLIHSELFDLRDDIVRVPANSRRTINSIGYSKNSSTRVTVLGETGQRLSLRCQIHFSQMTRRAAQYYRRRTRCSNDYFYIGYDRHPRIVGAQYYCGNKTVTAQSVPTSGRPALVIGKIFNVKYLRRF